MYNHFIHITYQIVVLNWRLPELWLTIDTVLVLEVVSQLLSLDR